MLEREKVTVAENNQNNQNNQPKEQDINQLLKVRREKLKDLQDAGKDPFRITKFDVTHHSDEVKELYKYKKFCLNL